MKILRGLLLAACLTLFSQSAVANKNHELAMQSTFILYERSAGRFEDHKTVCTAFAFKKVSDGYLLRTSGHCFGRAPSDATYLVASGQLVENPDLQPVEVLNYVDDGKMDVGELHLKTSKKYQVLEMSSEPVKIDDKVFYVGYPEMVAQVVGTGRVQSGILQTEGPDKSDSCDICKGRFLVQTGGGPGASGSPVISERTGKVIGIYEGHVFENGVVVVPTPAIESYYQKVGHAQVVTTKNEQSERKPL